MTTIFISFISPAAFGD